MSFTLVLDKKKNAGIMFLAEALPTLPSLQQSGKMPPGKLTQNLAVSGPVPKDYRRDKRRSDLPWGSFRCDARRRFHSVDSVGVSRVTGIPTYTDNISILDGNSTENAID